MYVIKTKRGLKLKGLPYTDIIERLMQKSRITLEDFIVEEEKGIAVMCCSFDDRKEKEFVLKAIRRILGRDLVQIYECDNNEHDVIVRYMDKIPIRGRRRPKWVVIMETYAGAIINKLMRK